MSSCSSPPRSASSGRTGPCRGRCPRARAGCARNSADESTKTRAGLALCAGASTPCLSPLGNADFSVPSRLAPTANCSCCRPFSVGAHCLSWGRMRRSTVSPWRWTERGRRARDDLQRRVRAACPCGASRRRRERIASSCTRKRPGNDVSSSCSSPAKRGSSCRSRICGQVDALACRSCVGTTMRGVSGRSRARRPCSSSMP